MTDIKDDQKKPRKRSSKTSQIEELTGALQRVQADFVNYKRRAEEEKISAAQSGKQVLMLELLPVIDNIERALDNAPEDLKKNEYVKGLRSVSKQLAEALKKAGVHKINTIGLEFDPESMDAVAVEGEGEKEIVTQELQAGYIMGGYIIRHAMVKVGRE